ncbi:MAG: nucleotidyltransferase family protein [Acidobacteriota bacterium]
MTDPVVGVVLAAGASRRMGDAGPKQLLSWLGRPLVRHATQTMRTADVAHTLVVVGHRGDEVAAALDELVERSADGRDVEVVRCAAWRDGQSASLRAGVEAARTAGAAAVLVMPCDQPFVDSALLDRLVAAYRAGASRVAVRYGAAEGTSPGEDSTRVGAPALFAARHFEALATLEGDRGARALLAHRAAEVVTVDADALAGADIDTLADHRRLSAQGAALG